MGNPVRRTATAIATAGTAILLGFTGSAFGAVRCVGTGGPDCTDGAVHTNVTEAVGAAVDDDTIRIAPGAFTYSGPAIGKRLTFVGAGPRLTTVTRPLVDAPTLSLTRGGEIRAMTVLGPSDPEGAVVPLGGFAAVAFVPGQAGTWSLTVANAVLRGGDSRRFELPFGAPGLVVANDNEDERIANVDVVGSGLIGGEGREVPLQGRGASFSASAGVATLDATGVNGGLWIGNSELAARNVTVFGGLFGSVGVHGSNVDLEQATVRGDVTVSSSPERAAALTIADSLVFEPQPAGPSPPTNSCQPALLRAFGDETRTAMVVARGSTIIGAPHRCAAIQAGGPFNQAPAEVGLRNSVALKAPGGFAGHDLLATGQSSAIAARSSSFSSANATDGGSVPIPGSGSNLTGDPQLVDLIGGDYRPRAGSPLIGAADPTLNEADERDLAGIRRSATMPTIGAYEADTELRIKISGRKRKLRRDGTVRVALTCPRSEQSPPCAGKLALRTKKRVRFRGSRRRVRLAATDFTLDVGERRALGLRLGARKMQLVRELRAARRVSATVTVRDQVGNERIVERRLKLNHRG